MLSAVHSPRLFALQADLFYFGSPGDKTCPDYALINTKNNGGLVYPSKSACKILETQKGLSNQGSKKRATTIYTSSYDIKYYSDYSIHSEFFRGDNGLSYRECCLQYTVQDCFHYKQTCSCGSPGDKMSPDYALINTKNNGDLVYPSKSVCKILETQKGLLNQGL